MSSSLKRAFIAIGLFFVVFFAAIFVTVKTAVKSYEPPTDPAYHEKGMDYQKRIDEFNRAEERGWTARVNLLDAETIRSGKNELSVVVEKDASKPPGEFGSADRVAVLVTISHPASIEGGKTYRFLASDLVRSANRLELKKEVEVPLKGTVEVAVEIRPDEDSAIHMSKKLLVE